MATKIITTPKVERILTDAGYKPWNVAEGTAGFHVMNAKTGANSERRGVLISLAIPGVRKEYTEEQLEAAHNMALEYETALVELAIPVEVITIEGKPTFLRVCEYDDEKHKAAVRGHKNTAAVVGVLPVVHEENALVAGREYKLIGGHDRYKGRNVRVVAVHEKKVDIEFDYRGTKVKMSVRHSSLGALNA
jgi:hypothetical protein